MGRKRLEDKKVKVNVSINPKIMKALKEDGVNISRLFSIFAIIYLRKKKKKVDKE